MIALQIRSNTTFKLNYDSGHLEPFVELIILTNSPDYKVSNKGQVQKYPGLKEVRFELPPDGVKQMLAELHLANNQAQGMEVMSHALNSVIDSFKQKKESKND